MRDRIRLTGQTNHFRFRQDSDKGGAILVEKVAVPGSVRLRCPGSSWNFETKLYLACGQLDANFARFAINHPGIGPGPPELQPSEGFHRIHSKGIQSGECFGGRCDQPWDKQV